MAKFCKACGKELVEGMKFCAECGAVIDAEDIPQADNANTAEGYGATPGASPAGAAPVGGGGQQAQQAVDNLKKFAQNTAEHTGEYDPADIEKNKMMSCLAYIPILFFLPLVTCPDSKFGRFHANQGLMCLIMFVAGAIATSIVSAIFSFLWVLSFLAGLVRVVIYLAMFAIMIVGMVNTYSGKAKDLPLFGTVRILK